MRTVIVSISTVFLFLTGVNAKHTLHLGVLVSQEGDIDLSGYIPAMNLALETIKKDETLPFNFDVMLNDSKVSRCDYMHCYNSHRQRKLVSAI